VPSALVFNTGVSSGIERMRINSTGNVGIGTSNPTQKLTVRGGRSVFQANSETYSLQLEYGAGTGQYYIGATNSADPDLVFSNVAGTERMRITSAGNVGIGTSSPTSKLTVTQGTAGATSVVFNGVASRYTFDFNGGGASYFDQASLNFRKFDGTNCGALDTGTNTVLNLVSSTGYSLLVLNTASGNISYLDFTANSVATSRITGSVSNGLTFATGSSNTERMRIDSSGNVGIGTTSPDALLTVNTIASFGDGAVGTPSIAHKGDLNTGMWFPAADTIAFSEGGAEAMRITSAGNVGIGTTSPAGAGLFLNIQGSTSSSLVAGSTSNANFVSLYSGQTVDANPSVLFNNSLRFGTATSPDTTGYTERMRIHASGGVSIGNTTDSGAASLNVSGSISGGYIAHANGTTAMAFGSDNVARVTPNATATFTSTVPAAGAICVLSILTSGTTSYTITFGTGFKSTGTLATGTVSARYFNITFVSDGTSLIEMSRTTAIT
jgi:hypothetical protein